ncbi:MAG: hypothetical protein ACREBG_31010 [Pyrinomonadaceae bacterium]
MSKVILLVILVAFAVSASVGNSRIDLAGAQQQSSGKALNDEGRAIRVTIMTGGGLFGPPKDRYKVGEQVPVTISMTNTSTQPVYVCDSGTLYQDLPNLVKDGRILPYLKWQSFLLADSKKNNTCQQEDLPEPVILKPNESTVVDWLVLVDSTISTGALAWYDSLPAGKYELTIQRRFGCCDGPMVESNKISFEIVP